MAVGPSPPPLAQPSPASTGQAPQGDAKQAALLAQYKQQFPILKALQSPRQYVQVAEVIGKGNYGQVYRGRLNGSDAAVKVVFLKHGEVKETLDEVAMLQRCNHPNITHFTNAFLDGLDLWICMEFCSAGALDVLNKRLTRPLSEMEISYILVETCKGLDYLHNDVPLIHRDIKAGNILLTLDGKIKLADFGVSKMLHSPHSTSSTFIGTPYWMAPEVILTENVKSARYTTKCDIWSLGITTIEIADKNPPLSDIHPMRALTLIPKANITLAQPKQRSKHMNDFISKCLQRNPSKRPTAEAALSHPFLIISGTAFPQLMVDLIRDSLNPTTSPASPKRLDASLKAAESIETSGSSGQEANKPVLTARKVKPTLLGSVPSSLAVKCADRLGRFVLIGTDKGLYATSVDGGPTFLVLQTRIKQTTVLLEINVVIFLCGKHDQIRQYNASSLIQCCEHFHSVACGKKVAGDLSGLNLALADFVKLPNTKDSLLLRHLRTIDTNFIILVNKREIILFEWATFPYQKFLKIRAFWLPQVPSDFDVFHDGSNISEIVLYFDYSPPALITFHDGKITNLPGVQSLHQIPIPPQSGTEGPDHARQRNFTTKRREYTVPRYFIATSMGETYISDINGRKMTHFRSASVNGSADWTMGVRWQTPVHKIILDDFSAVIGVSASGLEARSWTSAHLLDAITCESGPISVLGICKGFGVFCSTSVQRKTFVFLVRSCQPDMQPPVTPSPASKGHIPTPRSVSAIPSGNGSTRSAMDATKPAEEPETRDSSMLHDTLTLTNQEPQPSEPTSSEQNMLNSQQPTSRLAQLVEQELADELESLVIGDLSSDVDLASSVNMKSRASMYTEHSESPTVGHLASDFFALDVNVVHKDGSTSEQAELSLMNSVKETISLDNPSDNFKSPSISAAESNESNLKPEQGVSFKALAPSISDSELSRDEALSGLLESYQTSPPKMITSIAANESASVPSIEGSLETAFPAQLQPDIYGYTVQSASPQPLMSTRSSSADSVLPPPAVPTRTETIGGIIDSYSSASRVFLGSNSAANVPNNAVFDRNAPPLEPAGSSSVGGGVYPRPAAVYAESNRPRPFRPLPPSPSSNGQPRSYYGPLPPPPPIAGYPRPSAGYYPGPNQGPPLGYYPGPVPSSPHGQVGPHGDGIVRPDPRQSMLQHMQYVNHSANMAPGVRPGQPRPYPGPYPYAIDPSRPPIMSPQPYPPPGYYYGPPRHAPPAGSYPHPHYRSNSDSASLMSFASSNSAQSMAPSQPYPGSAAHQPVYDAGPSHPARMPLTAAPTPPAPIPPPVPSAADDSEAAEPSSKPLARLFAKLPMGKKYKKGVPLGMMLNANSVKVEAPEPAPPPVQPQPSPYPPYPPPQNMQFIPGRPPPIAYYRGPPPPQSYPYRPPPQ